MDSSVGSSSLSPSMPMLNDFVRDEKEDMRRWLRAEMNSLVDPLIESLFHKFSNKFKNSLEQKQSGYGGDSAQVNDDNLEPSHAQPQTYFNVPNRISPHFYKQHKYYSQVEPNKQINIFDVNSNEHGVQKSFVQSTSSTNTQVNDEFTNNFESHQIKQEIEDAENVLVSPDKSLCPATLCEPILSDQSSHDLKNWEDEDEDDCDCEDCLNGGTHFKEEDKGEYDISFKVDNNENGEESSGPVKKPRLDTSQSNDVSQPQIPWHLLRQPNNENNNESIVYTTLQLKCLQFDCSQMFGDKDQLDQHMLDIHSTRPFRCLIKDCGESFGDRQSQREHIKHVHSNSTEFHCDYCPKYFTSYDSLFNHTAQFHYLGQFQCLIPDCGFISDSRGKAYHHRDVEHRRELICRHPGCQYRTHKHQNLKTHQRSHLGIKPYRCKWPSCGYASPQRPNVLTHIRNVHLNPSKIPFGIEQYGEPKDYLEVARELL